jgi:hypothetical protein
MKSEMLGSLVLGLFVMCPVLAQPANPPRLGDDRRQTDQQQQPGVAGGSQPGGLDRPGGSGPPRLGSDPGHSEHGPRNIDTRGFGSGRGQQIDTSVLDPKVLEKELKLDWKQKDEVEQIFREYQAAVADLKRKSQGDQRQRERERLEQELKMARQARDTQRAAEILNKLREFRTDASDEEREMREQLIEEIEKVLDEGRKAQFRRMLRPGAGGAPPPLDDPKVLFQCVQQIKLQEYQKPQLEGIKKRAEEEMQRRSQGGQSMQPEEEKMFRKRVMDEVFAVLTPDQEKELQAVHARMGGDQGAGGGTPIDLKDMQQLRYAIMQLRSTPNRLDQQQETEMRQLQMDYFQEFRNRRDEQSRKQLDEEFSQKILNLLKQEQKEAIENMQMPTGRFPGGMRHGRGGREDSGGRGGMRSFDRSGGGMQPAAPGSGANEHEHSDRDTGGFNR